ncbi:hypothetical protein ONE63_007560 [Megalurothrips usitatus]|uniref:Macro domain-containing protein n=1 Tax=Megalurothrips usitatus TaxID=439358 RepID=A0AAV7XS72_9NEOP|nr:hypothetical protein ONE63_007560 [Megalurothrips usitatus]
MSNVCQQVVSKLIRAGSLPRRPAMMMSSPWLNESGNPYRRKSSTVENSTVVREEEGDLFRAPRSTSLAHCVSSDMKMGAGIAVHFKKKFGQVEYLLSQKKSPGEVAVLKNGPRYIFYLVSKKRFYDKPTNSSLQSCLLEMKQLCEELGVKNLAMPRIGCGLDRLKWPLVFEMLKDIFSNCDINITVYSIPDNKPKFMTPTFSRSQEKFQSYCGIKTPHSLPTSQMTSKRKIHSDSEEDFETPKKRLRISSSSRPRGFDLADVDSPSSPHFLRKCLKRSAEHGNTISSSQNDSYPVIINDYLSPSQHGGSGSLVYDKNGSKTEIPFLSDYEEGSIKVTSSKSCPSKSNEGSPEHQNARLVNKKLTQSSTHYQASSDDTSDNEGKSPVPSKGKSRERKSRDSRKSKDKKSRDKSKRKERKSRKSSKSKERKSRDTSRSKERKSRESSKSKERKSRESSRSKERKSRESSRSKEKRSRSLSRKREKGLSGKSRSTERKSHADWSDEETSEIKSREIDVCKRRNVRGSKWNEKHELEDSHGSGEAAENSGSLTKSQKMSREVEDSDDMSDKIDIPRSLLKEGVRVQLNIAENSGTITISRKLSRENENSDDMLDRCDFRTGHRKQSMKERPHPSENLNVGTSSQKFVDSDDMSDESDFPRGQPEPSVRKRLGGCVSKSSITTEPKSADTRLKHQPYPALNISVKKRTESPTGTMYCDRKTAATSVKARLSLGNRTH